MRRHEHFHVVFGHPIAAFAFDQNLVNLAVIKIADRAFDQAAFFINRRRRNGFQGQVADLFPLPQKIVVIALDLGLGALGTRRAHDQPGTFRHLDVIGDFLQFLAVGRIGDLAGNPAATRGVGHQHAIAPGQRQIGGEGSAFIATLFLDDLDQQDLANLDDFLDLIATRAWFAARADVFLLVFLGNRFDTGVFFVSRGNLFDVVILIAIQIVVVLIIIR